MDRDAGGFFRLFLPGLGASVGSFDADFVAGFEFVVEVPLGGHSHGLVDGVVYLFGLEHGWALGVHLDVYEVAARLAVAVWGVGGFHGAVLLAGGACC